MASQRQRIYVAGVGGMGAMTASRLLGEAALRAGKNVVVGEIHGMSQRGGVVQSSVLIGPGKGCLIDDGEADALLALEPVEALRALPKVRHDALVIANTHQVIPYTVAVGGAPYPDVDGVMRRVRDAVGTLVAFNAHEVGVSAGSARAANIALIGALAESGALPFDAAHLEALIAERPRGREANLLAFAEGRKIYAAQCKAGPAEDGAPREQAQRRSP